MIKFKEIRLYPSEFTLDVYVAEDVSLLKDIFKAQYGANEAFLSIMHKDMAIMFETSIDASMKGNRVFVLILSSLNPKLVFHELIHFMWQFADVSGVEMTTDSQEWQALFIEYITEQILKDDYDTKG